MDSLTELHKVMYGQNDPRYKELDDARNDLQHCLSMVGAESRFLLPAIERFVDAKLAMAGPKVT